MRGDFLNLNFKAFNKQLSGLIVKCLEIPHYAYSSRYGHLKNEIFNTYNKSNIEFGFVCSDK